MRTDVGEGYRRPLLDLDVYVIRNKAHNACRLNPWNLFQLRLTLCQRNKKNVTSDVCPKNFQDLRMAHVMSSRNSNVFARINAETPGVLAVAVNRADCHACYCGNCQGCEHT